ncbi:MAG: hypothetical protein WC360_03920 [Opitutales bacterium]|jgi:hypothetical protein
MMEALLAVGLLNAGRDLLGGIVNAVSKTATDSFDQILKTESAKAGTSTAALDAGSLKIKISQLGKSLSATPEVRSFIGADKSFSVRPDGGGYVIERADGLEMRLPKDSVAESFARDFNACNVASAQLGGKGLPASSECRWLVPVEA